MCSGLQELCSGLKEQPAGRGALFRAQEALFGGQGALFRAQEEVSGGPKACCSVPDTTPDAIAFRVSGSFEDVAESVAGMFDTGFAWAVQWSNTDLYTVETFVLGGGLYDVEVRHNGSQVWSN